MNDHIASSPFSDIYLSTSVFPAPLFVADSRVLPFSLSFSLASILDLDLCLIPFTYIILSHNSFLSFANYISSY